VTDGSFVAERIGVRDTIVYRLRAQREGRPLVYLHSVAGEVLALPFFNFLAAERELHVPGHPGFSETPESNEIRDVEDLAYHYLDYFDTHGWREVDVVGSCLGGWVAAEIASRNPGRVRSLTLLGATGLQVPASPIAELFGLSADETCALLFESRDNRLAECLAVSPAAQSIGLSKPVELPLYRNQTAAARYGWSPYFSAPKLLGRLPRISARTLIVWGAQDRFVPRAHAEAYQQRIRGASLTVLPGVDTFLLSSGPPR
jgi:pimeloyl-ACP methyl ester carboxylesterase